MKRTNAAAFCRDVQTDELLRAQVQRISNDEQRTERLVDLGRRSGYRFTAAELSAAMGQQAVGTSPVVQLNVSQSLSEQQLAAVSGAGWSMEEHWGVTLKKPGGLNPVGPIIPGTLP